ncbi:hypothetical protein ACTMSW_26670 [Micromonospora sp. BQ11]|uniref:hypothetical protein n=1 Tax=Micromonospora sp. BQ11 TaxID=3452212 RepID=UPI003F8A9693
MGDPDEIAAAFRGTVLDGLPIEEGLGDTWVVTGIDTRQLLPAWRAARAATAKTGRWPVLTTVDQWWMDAEREQVRRDLPVPPTLVAVERWTWERLVADPAALEKVWTRTAPYVGSE